jgi:hypothetical protein
MKKESLPLNWFLFDQEIPVREMVELATMNWLAAQSFGPENDLGESGLLELGNGTPASASGACTRKLVCGRKRAKVSPSAASCTT